MRRYDPKFFRITGCEDDAFGRPIRRLDAVPDVLTHFGTPGGGIVLTRQSEVEVKLLICDILDQ